MEINVNMTASFKPEDITKLISEYLNKEGFLVEGIDVKIKKRTIGHQINEYEESYFDGIDVRIKKMSSN